MFTARLLIPFLLGSTLIGSKGPQSLNAHDGSTAPPRLVIVQAMWGMIGYPSREDDWSLEEKLRRIKAAGFDAVDTVVQIGRAHV